MSGEKRSVSRVTSPISRGLFSSASLVGIHVPIEVRLDGVGAVLGEVEGGERLFQDLALHLFAGLGVDQSDALQELVVGLDRTDPLPCFALGDVAVAGRAVVAGTAVGAEAIDRRLDEGGAAILTRALDRFLGCFVYREHVGAVDEYARHAVRRCPFPDHAPGMLPRRQRRLHGVVVVLAEIDHRQLPERSEVQAFGRDPFFDAGFAEKYHANALELPHPRRERRPCRDGDRPADDRRRARHAHFLVDEVHRAAARSGTTVDAAEHLGKHGLEVATLREVVAVGAVAAIEKVGVGERGTASDRGRFLPDHEVDRGLHLVLVVALLDLLLDDPDAQHRAKQAQQELAVVVADSTCPVLVPRPRILESDTHLKLQSPVTIKALRVAYMLLVLVIVRLPFTAPKGRSAGRARPGCPSSRSGTEHGPGATASPAPPSGAPAARRGERSRRRRRPEACRRWHPYCAPIRRWHRYRKWTPCRIAGAYTSSPGATAARTPRSGQCSTAAPRRPGPPVPA